ncbi:MAG: hypothetical protein ACI87W_000382 [Halieaceae bacterium]
MDCCVLVLGYHWQRTRLDGNSDDFAGRFSQRIHGPQLGLWLSL